MANVGLIAHVRFQWPNGRYTSNQRVDATVAYSCTNPTPYTTSTSNNTFTLPDPAVPTRIEPVICLPGTEIGIEVENRASLNQGTFSVIIEFRGRLRRFLRHEAKTKLQTGQSGQNLGGLQASDFLSDKECGYATPDQPYVELPQSIVYTSPALETGAIITNARQPVGGLGIFIICGVLVLPPPVAGAGIQ